MNQANRGFSLLEVLIAGVLFVVAATGVVSSWRTVVGLAETQQRSGEALTLGEDVLDDLRLAFRDSPDLTDGVHQRFFDRRRSPVGAANPLGFTVEWTIAVVPGQTFKRLDLAVRWNGTDARPHRLLFVTYRSG